MQRLEVSGVKWLIRLTHAMQNFISVDITYLHRVGVEMDAPWSSSSVSGERGVEFRQSGIVCIFISLYGLCKMPIRTPLKHIGKRRYNSTYS